MAGRAKGPNPLQREFGDRIRARRSELDLSQEQVALAAGLHRSYVGQLEAGTRNPSLQNIVRISRALELDPGEMVRGLDQFPGWD